MTLSTLKTLLEGVNSGSFTNKVAYRAFPVGSAPALPFICILETETDNFTADSKVYVKRQYVDIELYTHIKSPETEAAIEGMFNLNELIWDKSEDYISEEEVLRITYEVVI